MNGLIGLRYHIILVQWIELVRKDKASDWSYFYHNQLHCKASNTLVQFMASTQHPVDIACLSVSLIQTCSYGRLLDFASSFIKQRISATAPAQECTLYSKFTWQKDDSLERVMMYDLFRGCACSVVYRVRDVETVQCGVLFGNFMVVLLQELGAWTYFNIIAIDSQAGVSDHWSASVQVAYARMLNAKAMTYELSGADSEEQKYWDLYLSNSADGIDIEPPTPEQLADANASSNYQDELSDDDDYWNQY